MSANPFIPDNAADAFSPIYFATIFMVYETTSLLHQAVRYFPRSGKEHIVLRLGAAHLIALTLLQTALQLWNTWDTLVKGFGDFANAAHINFVTQIQPLLTVLMAFPLQALMVYRCITFLKLHILVAIPFVLLLCFVAAVGLVDSILVLSFNFNAVVPQSDTTVITSPMWLLSSAFLDAATSISLSIHLMRSKQRSSSHNLHKLMSRAVTLMWEVALPPSVCAVIACITHFIVDLTPPSTNMLAWSIVFVNILGQLYALSYFITLNFRYKMQREQQTNRYQLSDIKVSRTTDGATPIVRDGQIRIDVQTFQTTTDAYDESPAYRKGHRYIESESRSPPRRF